MVDLIHAHDLLRAGKPNRHVHLEEPLVETSFTHVLRFVEGGDIHGDLSTQRFLKLAGHGKVLAYQAFFV